jgi:hypothetical protein
VPGEGGEAPSAGGPKRVRRVKRPASHTQCDPCGFNAGLQSSPLTEWWATTVSGAWDTAKDALNAGMQQGTTSQADVADLVQRQDSAQRVLGSGDSSAALQSASASAKELRRRRKTKKVAVASGDSAQPGVPADLGDGEGGPAVESMPLASISDRSGEWQGGQEEVGAGDGDVDAQTAQAEAVAAGGGVPSPETTFRRRATYNDAGGNDDNKRDGGGITDGSFPGLEYLQRIYAPPALRAQYEQLERELESPEYKLYSPEEQAEVREELLVVQQGIEQRENRLNKFLATVGSLHGMYVGVIASMLTVFVPQQCPPTPLVSDFHTCTLNEVMGLIKSDRFELAVFVLNLFTLVLVVITEYMLFTREKYLDMALSYNPRKPANNLSAKRPDGSPSLLEQHPYVAHALLWQNITTGNLARTSISMVALNLVVSSALIIGFHFAGSASVIALITNTLLLGSKLLYASVICLTGNNPRQGTSLFKFQRVSFNVLDSNFLSSEAYAKNRHRYTWDDVEAEYARFVQAEQGDVHMMASQAREVLNVLVRSKDPLKQQRSFQARRVSRRGKSFRDRVAAAVSQELKQTGGGSGQWGREREEGDGGDDAAGEQPADCEAPEGNGAAPEMEPSPGASPGRLRLKSILRIKRSVPAKAQKSEAPVEEGEEHWAGP